MRKKIVAGNWKMNNTIEESVKLASDLKNILAEKPAHGVDVVVNPTSLSLSSVVAALKGSTVAVGGQNCYSKASGAYTGEVSAPMLKSAGAEYVILGHSERREYFKESDALLAEKVNIALENGLTPIFCIGETLSEREANIHLNLVRDQVANGLFHLSPDQFAKVVLAYEPVWAIGTGVTASSAQAQEMHKIIRDHVASKYGQQVADQTSILYGGSCKPDNAQELFACPDVDGGLIGGASLKATDFAQIAYSF